MTSYRGKISEFYCDLRYTWFTVKQVNYVNNIQPTYGSVTKEMIWLNCDINLKEKYCIKIGENQVYYFTG